MGQKSKQRSLPLALVTTAFSKYVALSKRLQTGLYPGMVSRRLLVHVRREYARGGTVVHSVHMHLRAPGHSKHLICNTSVPP